MTAEEYLISKGLKGVGNLLVRSHSNYSENGTQKLMVEFAKYHVEKALKSVIENHEIDDYDEHQEYSPSLNEKSVLNAYSLENIK